MFTHKTKDCSWDDREQHPLASLVIFIGARIPHLRALSFRECEAPSYMLADLLGPRARHRTSIQSLSLVNTGRMQERTVQFLFCHLQFNHTSAVFTHLDLDNEEDMRAATVDFEEFERVEIDAEWTDLTERLYMASPIAEFPFSSLHTLNLSVASETGDELFLVFCTGLFPVLKQFSLQGHFRAWVLVDSERFFLRRSLHR